MMRNHAQNVVEKLFPDPFLKNLHNFKGFSLKQIKQFINFDIPTTWIIFEESYPNLNNYTTKHWNK